MTSRNWTAMLSFCLYARLPGRSMAMRVRSMVGLIPLFACLTLEDEVIQKLPDFKKRLNWFLKNRQDLAKQVKHVLEIIIIVNMQGLL